MSETARGGRRSRAAQAEPGPAQAPLVAVYLTVGVRTSARRPANSRP